MNSNDQKHELPFTKQTPPSCMPKRIQSSLNVVLFPNRKEFEGKQGSIRFIECSKFSCAVSIQDELLIVFTSFL
ncbi:hypothetical protein M514_28463 [Trichuris suis]|uniref:Uncharacterized protein n=1 Tax=Trichuris suis TaxID=68888 RepID=A0A085MQ62_9BILA|nr:hypothetical protein M514_28463 [Trichuris suis]